MNHDTFPSHEQCQSRWSAVWFNVSPFSTKINIIHISVFSHLISWKRVFWMWQILHFPTCFKSSAAKRHSRKSYHLHGICMWSVYDVLTKEHAVPESEHATCHFSISALLQLSLLATPRNTLWHISYNHCYGGNWKKYIKCITNDRKRHILRSNMTHHGDTKTPYVWLDTVAFLVEVRVDPLGLK